MRNHFLRTVGGSAAAAGPSDPWELTNMYHELNSPRPLNWFHAEWGDNSQHPMVFKPDGTKLFYTKTASPTVIYSINLDTAWDFLSFDWDNISQKSSMSGLGNVYGMAFSSDGTKLYLTDGTDYEVKQFNLSTAWDITTLSTSPDETFDFSTYSTSGIRGLTFKPDGSMMFVCHRNAVSPYSTRSVQAFDLGTSWSLGGTVTHNDSYVVGGSVESALYSIAFKPDGTRMYVTGSTNGTIHQYTLTTAWDISTASSRTDCGTLKVPQNGPTLWPCNLQFSSDGSFAMICSEQGHPSIKVDFSTAYDVTTASITFPSTRWFQDTNQIDVNGLFIGDSGDKMFLTTGNNKLLSYDLSTSYDITSAGNVSEYTNSTYLDDPHGVSFKSDGTKMYTCDEDRDNVEEWTLSTAWDISTISWSQSLDISGNVNNPKGLYFKPDGSALFVWDQNSTRIYKYTLSTDWDVSTGSYDSYASFTTIDGEGYSWSNDRPHNLFFKSDGTKLYFTMTADHLYGNYILFEFDLSTAWDLSTTSYVQQKVLMDYNTSAGAPFWINDDGTQLVMAQSVSRGIVSFNL